MEFRSINIDQELQNESFNNIKDCVQGTKGGGVQEREDMNEAQDFHVLAVDDSSIDRKILEKLLSVSSNYHVTLVESGDKALEYLGLSDHDSHIHPSSGHDDSSETVVQQGNETRVNLIMTDYSMPGMTGYDLLKRVKGSPWKDVPVVVMSSENVPSRINMCMEEGAEEFLLKPLRMSDLKRLQRYLLKSSCKNISIPNNHNVNEAHEGTEDYNDNGFGKRKAMVQESPDRRPKFELEGVAAL